MSSNFELKDIAHIFEQALCPGEIGFTKDGYLSPCFTNTYLFSPIAILLTIWALKDVKNLNTNGHPANALTSRINFGFTALYVFVCITYGPDMFNEISATVSLFTMMIVFLLSFFDLKGVNIPQKPLELYFFLIAGLSGYLTVQSIGIHRYDERLRSLTYICVVSSLAGSARNIIAAFEDAQTAAVKPKQE